MPSYDQSAIVTQLQAWLARCNLPPNSKLPPERELCEILGVKRTGLRRALDQMASEGQIWRHVGKGTFVGGRIVEVLDLVEISSQTKPYDVMRARLLLEPQVAYEAALNATAANVAALRESLQSILAAKTWREYETADNQLHRTIALSTDNRLLITLFDAFNSVRRTVVWGRLRGEFVQMRVDHVSFLEHVAIVDAIANRDGNAAHDSMLRHLRSVEFGLLGTKGALPPASGIGAAKPVALVDQARS